MSSPMELRDKQVVVIAGGAGRLGLQAAAFYLHKGMLVILVDRNELALEQALKTLGHQHLTCIVADITLSADTQHYSTEIYRQFGRLDTYIHCIGINAQLKSIVEVPEEDFLYGSYIHFTGIWLAFQYTLPQISRDGLFIIVTETGKRENMAGLSTTRKYADIPQFIKKHAKRYADRNISICSFDPLSFERVITVMSKQVLRMDLKLSLKKNVS